MPIFMPFDAAAERLGVVLDLRRLDAADRSRRRPASTSSSSALSATFAVIGPVWSTKISIGMMPV